MTAAILPTLAELADFYPLATAAKHAEMLSPASAAILEDCLKQNPLDLLNRARLLGFYTRYYWNRITHTTKRYKQLRAVHIAWFVENIPDCKFAGDKYFYVDNSSDEQNYSRIGGAWNDALKRASLRQQARINAAIFFFHQDRTKCTQLLKSVMRENEVNAWARQLMQKLEPDGPRTELTGTEFLDTMESSSTAKSLLSLCDRSFLHRAFWDGEELSCRSEQTLTRVLAKYPLDVSVRAELVGYYGARTTRENMLGCDPEYEDSFAKHLIWFFKYAPGAKDLCHVRFPELTTQTLLLLRSAWDKCNGGDETAAVLANATALLQGLKVESTAAKRSSSRSLKKRGFLTNKPGAQDRVAVSPGAIEFLGKPPHEISLTEWANACFMDKAQLIGSYAWFAPGTIKHLDEMIEENSIDFFNRAKIIGFYRDSPERDREAKNLSAMYTKHITWLIQNVPDCDFMRQVYWEGLATVPHLQKTLMKEWHHIASKSNNVEILINAALANLKHDRKQAHAYINAAMIIAPANEFAIRLKNARTRNTSAAGAEILRLRNFRPGKKSGELTKVSKNFDHAAAWLFGKLTPARSIWSSEQLVHNNPHEMFVRTELIGYYGQHKYCHGIDESDPRFSERLRSHILWFIENTPECKGVAVGGNSHLDPIGYESIVLAWKQQLASYPRNAAIAYNASRAFSSDSKYLREGLACMKRAIRFHPNNKELLGSLDHLRKLSKPI